MNEAGLAVEARGLTRRFGDLVAVDGVDLAIPRARIFGFLGPNGSGKTTTLRMLCGLLIPSSGEAEVLSLRIPADAEKLRRKLGYMTQHFSLYDDLTVRENLEFMGEIHSLPASRRSQRVDALLDRYALEERAGQRVGTLSGGQKQRLALASAVIHEPELLFLDEPTAGVDPQSRRDFWESLFVLVDEGATILVSTHYMDEAERCHSLAILDRGVLVTEGAPRELVADLAARAFDVVSETMHAARTAIEPLEGVLSAAQLGGRLHVLVDQSIPDPGARIAAALDGAGVEARVEPSAPSLEDVFVAATGARRHPERA